LKIKLEKSNRCSTLFTIKIKTYLLPEKMRIITITTINNINVNIHLRHKKISKLWISIKIISFSQDGNIDVIFLTIELDKKKIFKISNKKENL